MLEFTGLWRTSVACLSVSICLPELLLESTEFRSTPSADCCSPNCAGTCEISPDEASFYFRFAMRSMFVRRPFWFVACREEYLLSGRRSSGDSVCGRFTASC